MRKIECAASLLFLALSQCGKQQVDNNVTVTVPETTGVTGPGGAKEIKELPALESLKVNLTPGQQSALAVPAGTHLDADVRDNQLVLTPDRDASHIGPAATTITTGSGKKIPTSLSPAAIEFLRQHQTH